MKRNVSIVVFLLAVAVCSETLLAQPPALERRVRDTVRELGVVESAAMLELRSRVPGETVIVSVVPEGSEVQKGDLLISLDDSALREAVLKQQVILAQRMAGLEKAAAVVKASATQGDAQLAAAQLRLRAAELAKRRYLGEGGEFESALSAAERRIALAQQKLKTAEGLADSASETLTPALAIATAKAEVADAQAAHQLLTKHVREHQTVVFELAAVEAQAALAQAEASASVARATATAELKSQQAALELEQARLKQLEEQLRHCQITAPADGMVFYAATAQRRGAMIEPGAPVREGQPLVSVADPDKLQVEVEVHESQIDRVRVGQPVVVRLDAFPDRPLSGKVREIGRTPLPTTWIDSEKVKYGVTVSLAEVPEQVRIGMTGEAEIGVK